MKQQFVFPQFAPLSVPMILYLLDATYEEVLEDLSAPAPNRLLPG